MEILGVFVGMFILGGMLRQSIGEVSAEMKFNREQDFKLAERRYNELLNLIDDLKDEIEELKK